MVGQHVLLAYGGPLYVWTLLPLIFFFFYLGEQEQGNRRILTIDLHYTPTVLSKTCLLVHPVTFYLTDPSVILTLIASPAEVSAIWTFPLSSFLTSSAPPLPLQPATLVDLHRSPQTAYRTYSDVPWIAHDPYRLHRFRTTQQLVKGLTADILVHLAQDAYGTPAKFAVRAAGQPERHVWVQALLRPDGGSKRSTRWGDGEGEVDILPSAHKFDTVQGVDE